MMFLRQLNRCISAKLYDKDGARKYKRINKIIKMENIVRDSFEMG